MNLRQKIGRAMAAFAAFALGTTLFASTYYGVFVGVDYYTSGAGTLSGCDRDAVNMMDAYTANGNCLAANASTYIDYAATKSAVRTKFRQLATVARSGDTVVYYQSSHGGAYDSWGGSCICLSDDDWYDYEFADDLEEFAAGVRIVVIIDTCHSGGMFKADGAGATPEKGKFQFASSVQRILNERRAKRGESLAKSGASVGWITACDWDELSLAGRYGSVFTNAIMEGWKGGGADSNHDGSVTFAELGQYAIDNVNYSSYGQTTQMDNASLLSAVQAGSVFNPSNFRLLIANNILYGFVGNCASSISIPSGVEEIVESAFDSDYNAVANLASVTIPATMNYIGEFAFYGCSSLANVTFAGNRDDVEIELSAFQNTPVGSDFATSPDNDNFVDAEIITGRSGDVEGENIAASYEYGEPLYADHGSTSTVWYRWTAPMGGFATFNTSGSSFDTLLGVYTGSSVSALSLVAYNDDSGGSRTSEVSFEATSGVTYHIAVGGYNDATGRIQLGWFMSTATNDDFAGAQAISGATGSVETDNYSASYESGEPLYTNYGSTHTVWFRWTAPSSGTFTFDTNTSSFDTVLGVYTGSSVYSLTTVGENDDGASGSCSTVTFTAAYGTTYHIAVGGYNSRYGDICLSWHAGEYTEPGSVALTWETSRAAAISAAQAAGRRILLVSGRDSCSNTQYVRNTACAGATVSPILNDNFVLWYNNCDTQGEEIWEYASGLGGYTLPLVCALDPYDMDGYLARSTGFMDESDLHSFLAGLPSWTPPEPVPPGPVVTGTYYGIFAGVNYYTSGASTLVGCDRDAVNMMDAYTANGYCSAANSFAFINYDATKAAVRAKFQDLAAVARAGDTVVYYQSSHGGSYDNYGGSALCLTDDDWYDYEFADDLARFAPGVRVIVIIDTCYSGGMFKIDDGADGDASRKPQFQFAARTQRLLDERLAKRGGPSAKSGASVGWITACDWYELSTGGFYGSAFTNAIIEGWREGGADSNSDGTVTFSELGNYAVNNVSYSIYEQLAQIDNDTLLSAVQAGSVFDPAVSRLLICGDVLYGFVGPCPATLSVPSGIAEIAESSFDSDYNNVSALTSVTIPASMEYIGEYAFYGCSNLRTVNFLGNAAAVYIEEDAFAQTPYGNASNDDNDSFEGAMVITGDDSHLYDSSCDATYQSGEPLYTIYGSTHTRWYRWTAPYSSTFTFDTDESDFDTVLGVYVGSSLASLETIGRNDDNPLADTNASAVTFSASSGQTYYIAVGGYHDNCGSISLYWYYGEYVPLTTPNDDFAGAAVITGDNSHLSDSSCDATYQIGDPLYTIYGSTHIRWYRWTAPYSDTFTFDTDESDFDTVLGVYVGSSLASLETIGSNDDNPLADTNASAVTFSAVSGQTYYIAVGGYHDSCGSISLYWYYGEYVPLGPENDDFEDAEVISGASGAIEGDNINATYQGGEPFNNYVSSNHTVWYRWTAPFSGTVTFNTEGSELDTVLGAYTGSSLYGLSVVAQNDDAGCSYESAVTFQAASGTTYYIAVGGYHDGEGEFLLNWYRGPYGSVVFNANGGQGSMSSQGFGYDDEKPLPGNTFSRQGSLFLGWAYSPYATQPDFVDGEYYGYYGCGAGGTETLYAVWERIALWDGVASPQTGGSGDAPFTGETAAVYDAFIYDAQGNTVGTIQLKTAKAKAARGGGTSSKVSAAVQLAGERKLTLKGEMAVGTGVFEASASGRTLRLTFGANGVSGTFGEFFVDGGENKFASKDSGDKRIASSVLSAWSGACGVAWPGSQGWNCLTLVVGAKGKVKVGGYLEDGTKVSANAQLIIGEDTCVIPVVVTKKVSLAFNVKILSSGRLRVDGLGADVEVGKPGTLYAGSHFQVSRYASLWARLQGSVLLDYLPNGVSVTEAGGRWNVPKAGKVAYLRGTTNVDTAKLLENPSGLKLTYKAKDGSFKGSFKAYSDVGGRLKATKVSVVGVAINGEAYGTLSVRGAGVAGAWIW